MSLLSLVPYVASAGILQASTPTNLTGSVLRKVGVAAGRVHLYPDEKKFPVTAKAARGILEIHTDLADDAAAAWYEVVAAITADCAEQINRLVRKTDTVEDIQWGSI